MPSPSESHVSQALTNMSLLILQADTDFVAPKLFPLLPVAKQVDVYYEYNRGDFLRDEAAERAPATESAGADYRLDSSGTYNCKPYAFHRDVDEQERANADSVIKVDEDATSFVTRKLQIKRERLWVNGFFKTGIWGKEYTGGAFGGAPEFVQWSDTTNSDPLFDVGAARAYMAGQTGFKPNKMVVSPDVFQALCNHPKILDRIKYTQQGIITEALLAALFQVEDFLVTWSIYNSSADPAVPVYEYIGGTKSAALFYVAKAPGIKVPSAGYTFSWKGLLGSNAGGSRIKKFRMDHLEADRIEGEMAMDMKAIAPDLGIWFKTAIA